MPEGSRASPARPVVEVVLAMSADGRISDVERSSSRIASDEDRVHLDRRLAGADAVLMGAATVRAIGHGLAVRDPGLRADRRGRGKPDHPLQVIASRTGGVPPDLPITNGSFRCWLATPADVPAKSGFERHVARGEPGVDWESLLDDLAEDGVERLCVAGGGDLVASVVAAGLVDEFHLTVCPVLIGGVNAPTPLDGAGLPLGSMPALTLVTCNQVDQEVFLHYQVVRGVDGLTAR